MNEEMITISKFEYEDLKSDSNFLGCLEACGVDNWPGYEHALDMYQEEFEDSES